MSTHDGLLRLVRRCNGVKFTDTLARCVKFYVEGKQVGLIRSDFLAHLQNFPDTFIFKKSTEDPFQEVHLSDDLKTPDERTDKVESVLQMLRKNNDLITLKGWRDEKFGVSPSFADTDLLRIERSAACLFGVLQYGTHINGYTFAEDGQLKMWIGRRSPNKSTWPGKLDNMCAGGLPSGLDVNTCAIKECQEEASVPLEHLEKLKSVGSISYFYEDERGLFPDTQFIFDLELPSDFRPVNSDGEVASFQLLSIPELTELIVKDDFKPNCALIILDFCIRWGFIRPDNEPNYLYLIENMHYPLQSIYGYK